MKAMVEPDANRQPGFPGRRENGLQFVRVTRPGLFHQHVLAGLQRGGGHGRQLVVRRRDHHGIHVPALQHVASVGGHGTTRDGRGEFFRALADHIGRTDHLVRAGVLRALHPDQSAADDADVHRETFPHVAPRSSGTIRRSV